MVQQNKDEIYFHFLTNPFFFPKRKELKGYLRSLFKKEGKAVEQINYIFCKDEYLLSLNKMHLKHDTYTDIITFELSPKGEALVADIYISTERVRENAQTFQTPFQKELHRVIFHGALHLCGYKDKTKEQSQLMRTKEEENLSRYFVPRGTKKQRL
jgi:probable rRNA maturation factor